MAASEAPVALSEPSPRAAGLRRFHALRPHRPPGPRGRALVGNLQDFEADRLGFLLAARDDYGPVVAFDRRTTIINDATLARRLLHGTTGEWEVRENFLLHRLSPGQVAEVLETRTLLNSGLRPAAVAPVGRIAAALTRQWASSIEDDGSSGFDPVPEMEQIISTTVARYYFGEDFIAIPAACADLLDALALVIGNPFALPATWPSPARLRITQRYRRLHGLVVDRLRVREAQPHLFDDFATGVLTSRNPETQSLARVADLLIGSLLAAQRVPAATAGWLLLMLADRRDEQQALAGEAAAHSLTLLAAEGGLEVASYPRAHATLLETMRLYPATWLIARTATRTVTLGDYHFEAGHQFLISPYVIHRDPEYFPAPETFLPTRWTQVPRPSTLAYLPFGRGRHACPGSHLATSVLVSILLTLIDGHRIERIASVVTPNPRTTLLPQGLRIRLRPAGAGRVPDLGRHAVSPLF